MERCVECIDEVARLAPEGGPLAAYRILPQVFEYVRSMRDPFYLSLQTGELRGITQVELQASRIIELHAAMKNIIAMEETEMQYGRGGRQSKLDKALAERGMRRAPEAPYIAGDCVFDSISYRLHMIGLPVTSEGVREGAMRQLHHDYVNGLAEVFSFVIPYVEGNGYTSLGHYIDCMRRPVNKSPDRDRSWGDAVAIQWAAKAFKIEINKICGMKDRLPPPLSVQALITVAIDGGGVGIAIGGVDQPPLPEDQPPPLPLDQEDDMRE